MKIDLTKSRLPEANIQAEIYHVCRNRGINCILDYKTPIGSLKTRGGRQKNARLDVVLFDGNLNAVCIIEVKSYASKTKIPNLNTKQLNLYRILDVPLYVIGRIESVNRIIQEIVEKYPTVLHKAPKLKTYTPYADIITF